MKLLFDINHPADVHQFKHVIRQLKKAKHKVLVIARDKDCTHELLLNENIKFIPRKGYVGLVGKIIGILLIDFFILKCAKKFQPDVLVGSSGNLYVTHVGKLLGKPSIVFDDTEHAKIQNWLTFPFATKIITPASYKLDLGKKQIRYKGFKELASIHPDYFKPDKNVLKKYKVKGKLIILRFVSWDASHDVGIKGTDPAAILRRISKEGTVLISSEKALPVSFDKCLIKNPSDLHHLLFYADLCIGEGASTAVESSLMGTPTIYLNKLSLGYVEELEKKGLILHLKDQNAAINKGIDMLRKNTKQIWRKKLKTLYSFDLNKWMYDQLVRYAP